MAVLPRPKDPALVKIPELELRNSVEARRPNRLVTLAGVHGRLRVLERLIDQFYYFMADSAQMY